MQKLYIIKKDIPICAYLNDQRHRYNIEEKRGVEEKTMSFSKNNDIAPDSKSADITPAIDPMAPVQQFVGHDANLQFVLTLKEQGHDTSFMNDFVMWHVLKNPVILHFLRENNKKYRSLTEPGMWNHRLREEATDEDKLEYLREVFATVRKGYVFFFSDFGF